MRSNLELWLIVEENFDIYLQTGLCWLIFNLMQDDNLNINEYNFLYKVIQENHIKIKGDIEGFTWEPGDKKPRRMFIQKQILKAIRNEN